MFTPIPRSVVMFVVKALCAFPLLFSLTTAYGQYGYPYAYPHTSTTGSTPPGIAPGAPAGSYALSGFDTINPYNGRLNFNLPLMQISGRGNAGYGMMLPIERNWQARHTVSPICNQYGCDYGATAYHTYTAYIDWWNGLKPGYGPGVLIGRKTGKFPLNLPCSPPPWQFTITRLTFTAADGTEYELRDKNSGGASLTNNGGCNGPGPSRGTEFSSADGSAVTFVSDSTIYDASYGNAMFYPSGVLVMRDGTRYRIDNGLVSWIRDRNGNKTFYTYDIYNRITSSTDSLNRQVTITYAVTTNPDYDEIIFRGNGGASRSLRIYYASLGTRLRPGRNGCVNYDCYSLQTNGQLFPTLNGSSSTTFNPSVVSSVVLPDNRSYQFYYNNYGELARVDLPTGGVFEYDWTTATGNTGGEFWYSTNDNPLYIQEADIARRVKERRVYSDANTLEQKTTYGAIGVASQTVSYLKPDGTLISKEGHYYYGSPLYRPASPTDYPSWTDAREYRTDSFAADGTTLWRVSENEWQQGCGLPVFDSNVATNPRIASITSYLTDVSPNLVSKRTFSYDCYNNKTDIYEYDFGSGNFGALVRRTHTDYVTTNNNANYATDTNIHLRSLPSVTQVFDAANNKKAETQFEYDNYTPDANHAALVNRTNVTGFDASFNTGYVTRGNVTKVSQWRNTDNAYLSTYSQYDILGNAVKMIDANSNATNFEFNDRFGAPNGEAQSNSTPPAPGSTWLNGQTTFAFPTKVTNALGHIAYTQVDYFLSKPVDTEDPNNVKSSLYYNDALDRPTKGISAVGTSLQNQTVISYDDANKTIATATDKDANTDGILQSKALYDGLGRTYRKATYEGTLAGYVNPQWTMVETQFDALGRAYRNSNPFRGDTIAVTLPTNPEWTTSTFDALGRVTQVTTPDGAHVDTVYTGNQVLVTDQAGKQRRSLTDALGRLLRVDEPSGCNTCLGVVTAPSQPTSYSYDVLDSLTLITQGVQTRTFAYDSLKRLTSATNPESGTMTYQYDNNGNLTYKVDALSRSLTYYYDALNRSLGFISNQANTHQVAHYYDTAPNGKGKLHYSMTFDYYFGGSTQNAKSQTTIASYDVLGRPQIQYQQFRNAANTDWIYYTNSRTYDLASNVKSQTYPSGRVVNYDYNTAGQLTSFRGNLGNGVNRNYASEQTYSPAGLKTKEAYGKPTSGYVGMTTPLYLTPHYNNRHQLVDLRLGSLDNGWSDNRGILTFYYGTNAVNSWNPFADDTDNNGNLRRAFHYVPNTIDASGNVTNWVIPQLADYTYDELNRVKTYTESQNNGSSWTFNVAGQTFSYDRYGNRQITATLGGVNGYNPSYNASTNRIVGLTYDSVGNITNDGVRTMAYDTNNRQVSATVGGITSNYQYNANGSRISKAVGSAVTWYIYGLDGELVAEYPAHVTPTMPQTEYGYRGGELLIEGGCDVVRWRVTDHLGSTRMSVDTTGSLASVRRTDYLPFGEELMAGIRTNAGNGQYGYVADCWRQKFTSKERDFETGLDFFEARYYSNIQGRFTSPDEFVGGPEELYWFDGKVGHNPTFYAELAEPQSLNKYSYVLNNPLRYIDPTGHQTLAADALKLGAAVVGGASGGAAAAGVVGAGIVYIIVDKTVGWDKVGEGLNKLAEANARSGGWCDGYCAGTRGMMMKDQTQNQQPPQNQQGSSDQGTQKGSLQETKHSEQRKAEGSSGQDPRRDIGDKNRVKREGTRYVDQNTGNVVYVGKKGHTVIVDPTETKVVTRNTYTKKQVQNRVNDGRWVPSSGSE